MSQLTCRSRILVFSIACVALAGPALADVVENVPLLPPANGAYTVPAICMAPLCIENIALGDFVTTGMVISGGNELTQSNVTFTGDAYQDNMGSPGMFLGPVSMTGTVDITYLDKDRLSELGTFSTQVTSLNLDGTFTLPAPVGSHDVGAMLNPSESSTGTTTITQIGPNSYNVSSSLDVFAELSVNDGPFMPGPERTANLTSAVPEPSFYWVIAAVVGGIFAIRVARRKKTTGATAG